MTYKEGSVITVTTRRPRERRLTPRTLRFLSGPVHTGHQR